MRKVGVYWFGNDLRVSDQPGLQRAAAEVDELICLYVLDPAWAKPSRYGQTKPMGRHRQRFLLESLRGLDFELRRLGQHVSLVSARPLDIIPELITRFDITHLYRSEHPGFDERRDWRWLKEHYRQLNFIEVENQTLFAQADLPFVLDASDSNGLPPSFSAFRRKLEKAQVSAREPQALTVQLPPNPLPSGQWPALPESFSESTGAPFTGGERAASQHRSYYFNSTLPQRYKLDRNELDGWEFSTKLSPWLALGCQSARQVVADLRAHERRLGANESTEWILFELLWREYFHWYARVRGSALFHFGGQNDHKPNTSFYPERFRKWCTGNTPFALVNACMRQLNQTGYMSNRGRQLVASCLVNELAVDWRYGAAYFQQELVDYDVGSNWGNWQYIAGVGADPRGGRHFNLAKQAAQYDPGGEFVRRWGAGDTAQALDSVDAADWPLSST